ncbi:MAG TPA: gamma carbonic anhydrase family protein [Polyangiaceae bacterium]|jgi:carbonic anhydrase/acetyltransferase-like protein (isoleucine patch superfamily)
MMRKPDIARAAFVADDATIVGHVELGQDASIWFGTVIRGDNDLIAIGESSNVQDGSIVHTDAGIALRVGARVTVGHGAVLHGCTIEDECLIGIRSVLLNGSRIRRGSIVGACALVTEGKEFPERSLIIGSPARAVRTVTDDEIAAIRASAAHYVQNAHKFRTQFTRASE